VARDIGDCWAGWGEKAFTAEDSESAEERRLWERRFTTEITESTERDKKKM
jgi:hypothetical protein